MLQAIISGVLAIVCGIAANLLTPAARKALGFRPEPPPKAVKIQQVPEVESDNIEARRAANRRRLSELVAQCYFYGASFYVLFAAIYLPLGFKHFGASEPLDFTTTRIPIHVALSPDHFATLAAVVALILYVPCWLLAVRVASGVARIWRNYQQVTSIRFGAFITLAMFVFGFFICGNWIYLLFPQNSYLASVIYPFVAILFVAGVASSRK